MSNYCNSCHKNKDGEFFVIHPNECEHMRIGECPHEDDIADSDIDDIWNAVDDSEVEEME